MVDVARLTSSVATEWIIHYTLWYINSFPRNLYLSLRQSVCFWVKKYEKVFENVKKTAESAKGLPVLRGVIELDQPRIELLYQDSDYVHEEHKVDLLIEDQQFQIKKNIQL